MNLERLIPRAIITISQAKSAGLTINDSNVVDLLLDNLPQLKSVDDARKILMIDPDLYREFYHAATRR